ncbi:unnamed protein product [Caenorhabditis auriculariae]|uniref:Uncharacterized protein n=1 Tax=Caenorhabditis auriculariae TaxID=2777116 RepID=A0A8S1H9X4_9PELO|nr:unnamed protein product [Caenorhabditis auriculariae]
MDLNTDSVTPEPESQEILKEIGSFELSQKVVERELTNTEMLIKEALNLHERPDVQNLLYPPNHKPSFQCLPRFVGFFSSEMWKNKEDSSLFRPIPVYHESFTFSSPEKAQPDKWMDEVVLQPIGDQESVAKTVDILLQNGLEMPPKA